MRKSYVSGLLVLAALAVVSQTQAGLIYSIPAYANRFPGSEGWDNGAGSATLGFAFKFYGLNVTDITIGADGNINFHGADGDWGNVALASTANRRRIAPLWDDLETKTNGSYAAGDASVTDVYTASWYNMRVYNQPARLNTFQVSLFGADKTVAFGPGSFNFKAGDIAISYATITGPYADGFATVGVQDMSIGSGGTGSFTGLPGVPNGVIADATPLTSLNLTDAGKFLLYRPDNASNPTSYTVTIGDTAVPEPTSLTLLAVGAAGLLLRRRKAAR